METEKHAKVSMSSLKLFWHQLTSGLETVSLGEKYVLSSYCALLTMQS